MPLLNPCLLAAASSGGPPVNFRVRFAAPTFFLPCAACVLLEGCPGPGRVEPSSTHTYFTPQEHYLVRATTAKNLQSADKYDS